MYRPLALLMISTAIALTPAFAQAQGARAVEESRFISGTVGAIAGAMVGGPIGLIAGAALGYSMGPEVTGTTQRVGPRRRAVRQARRRYRGPTRTTMKIVLDCSVQANQENPACVDFLAKRQQQLLAQQAMYGQSVNVQQGYIQTQMIYGQQTLPQQRVYGQPGYLQQPGYPQQPVYLAPAQSGYSPLPAQGVQQQGVDPRQRMFNPRQNPLVPPPTAFGDGSQYSAALSGPNAAGQQGASGAYANTYSAPAPQGYGYGNAQAPPTPVRR